MAKQYIKYAKVQTGLFIPGLGEMGTTLPPSKTFSKFVMSLSNEGLLIETAFQNRSETWSVPYANVVLMVYGQKEEDASAKKAKEDGNKKD